MKTVTKIIRFLINVYKYIEMITLCAISFFMRIFPIQTNKIIICSYYGKDYGDNAKYVVEELLKKDTSKKLNIIWALQKDLLSHNQIPKRVKVVKYKSLKYLYDMVTAKIWLDNARKHFFPLKRKKQFYVQLWHGNLPLKTVELDTKKTLPRHYITKALIDSKNADLFMSGSKWASNLYRTAFKFNGRILEKGIPRDDVLFISSLHSNIKSKVFDYYKLNLNEKVVLYAPTFRENANLECYRFDYLKLIEALEKKYKKQIKLLIRLHPNISDASSKLVNYDKKIINATNYPDMQELLIASDILITDYSSIMFDFGMMNKPCFLYCVDIEKYLKERKFYFDIENLPFPFCQNDEELTHSILDFNVKKYKKEVQLFFNKIGLCETGHSAEEVANIIMKECEIDEK